MTRQHMVRLESVTQIQGGIQKQPHRRPTTNTYPFLRVANVTARGLDLAEIHQIELFPGELERFRLERGDLLVVEGNGSPDQIGRAALWDGSIPDTVHQNHLIRVRPGRELQPSYLELVWNSPNLRRVLTDISSSTSGLHTLSVRKLQSLEIPLPPRDEQRRIVDILEDHLSRLDAADALIAAQIERIALLRLSILTASAQEQAAAGVPSVPLGEFATTELGKMLDAKRSVGESSPYLRNINVRWGSFDLSDVRNVLLTDRERARLELRPGDLLVCEGGEPGRCAVWPGSNKLMAFQKALHRVRVPGRTADPRFVALMLEQFVRSGRADPLFTGTTIKHLPQEKLRLVPIPLPELTVQHAAVTKVDSLDSSLASVNTIVRAAQARSSSLRRALLGAAFSGRLTGRSSDLDIAEELMPA